MNCKYCENVKHRIYENENMIAFLDDFPVSIGHVVLIPKEHYVILEQVPENLMGEMFVFANKVSGILFEVLGVQGTNILINNGLDQEIPHFSINIIPRKENDNVNFEWNPAKTSEEELNNIVNLIKGSLNSKNSLEKIEKDSDVKTETSDTDNKDENDWISKLMTRLP